MKPNDLSGQKFGRLTVIKRAQNIKNKRVNWKCFCECGATTITTGDRLSRGITKSCGCLAKEALRNGGLANRKYPEDSERLQRILHGIKTRCNNENATSYQYYGGRGITICDEWNNDFMNFYNWAKNNGYSDELSIDRIDNEKGYEPENCRWVTQGEQMKNRRKWERRRVVFVSFRGGNVSIPELSEMYGIDRALLYDRIRRYGWSAEKAVTVPNRRGKA